MRLTWWLTIFILGSGAAGSFPAAGQLQKSVAAIAEDQSTVQSEVLAQEIAPENPLLLAQSDGDSDEGKDEKKDSGGGGGMRRWLLLGGGGVVGGGILAGGTWMFLRRRGDDYYEDELDDDEGGLEGDEVVLGAISDGDDEPTTMTVDVVGSAGSSDGDSGTASVEKDATPTNEAGEMTGAVARVKDSSLPTRVLPPTKADRLLAELRDPSASVRRRAIWNLGERGDSRAIAPLMELLVTADSQQRSIILAVLSEIGTRTLRPMERAMAISLQDSDPEVRLNAIRDLTQVYDRFAQVSRMLAYATEDENETVQKTAKWALGKLNSLRMNSEEASDKVADGGGVGLNVAGDGDGALLLDQARRACDDKDYDQASTLVAEALAQDPSHPKGHLLAAEIAAAQDHPVKAVVAEQQARDCAWDRGDSATAIAIQENWLAQEIDPDRATLCHAQAIQALRAGQTDNALGLLDEALVCNPYNPDVYMARARVLRQQGKLGDACAHWKKAQEIYLDLGDVKALRCVQQLLQKFS
ncbi:MAG: HEAT repeat domain-containing protein [Cyanobacteria bacterium P01_F01_bin.153]